MNPQEARDSLERQLPGITVEVVENYSNQHARNATRFIFTMGELKTNLMFKQGFKITDEVLDGVVTAINKKFEEGLKSQPQNQPVVNPKPTIEVPQAIQPTTPPKPIDYSLEMYEAAKKVVEAYEQEHAMT